MQIYTYTAYCADPGQREPTVVRRVVAADTYDNAARLGHLSVARPERCVVLFEMKPWRDEQ